jgi:hypothetical protein
MRVALAQSRKVQRRQLVRDWCDHDTLSLTSDIMVTSHTHDHVVLRQCDVLTTSYQLHQQPQIHCEYRFEFANARQVDAQFRSLKQSEAWSCCARTPGSCIVSKRCRRRSGQGVN